MTYDVAIVGGGIVGLATAYQLLQTDPSLRLAVLEKENEVASHQTGRNSGVIHAGVYYKPGSHKSRLCTQGKQELEAFCDANEIHYKTCGKAIVAVDESEIPQLEILHERATANGVPLDRVSIEELREKEPHVSAVAALWVHSTGVVNFGNVSNKLATNIASSGADIFTGEEVSSAAYDNGGWSVETSERTVQARTVVNCAGLWADRIACMFGTKPKVQLVPFRGEYVELKPEARKYCQTLIYPVPDPSFPFLGVHLTRRVSGVVEAGPSAVLAFSREGYRLGKIHFGQLTEVIRYGGFRKLARKHWRMGAKEMHRSLSTKAFLKALQRLVPEVSMNDLLPAKAGVRAQAVYPDGRLADDFVIEVTPNAVHVINAPSPAATASFAIGKHISGLVQERLA